MNPLGQRFLQEATSRKKLLGWRPSLFGWRPLLLVARSYKGITASSKKLLVTNLDLKNQRVWLDALSIPPEAAPPFSLCLHRQDNCETWTVGVKWKTMLSSETHQIVVSTQTLHVCRMPYMPTWGWFWGVNVGICGIHGVFGVWIRDFSTLRSICSDG